MVYQSFFPNPSNALNKSVFKCLLRIAFGIMHHSLNVKVINSELKDVHKTDLILKVIEQPFQ